MSIKEDLSRPMVFGSTVVSPKGQVVIPANARRELGINSGDTLLVCGPPHGQGLLLLKADAIKQILARVAEQLIDFEKMVKYHDSPKAASRKERVD